MLFGHTSQHRAGWLLAAGTLLALLYGVVPLVFWREAYWLSVLTNACLLSFAGLGVWLIFAIGRVNIAQGAFALIGGYTTAILSTFWGVSFWICLPVAALVSAAVGVLIGWPLLRLRGVYFAMVTLSLTEATRLFFLNTKLGGITDVPRPAGLSSPIAFYLFAATLLAIGCLGVWRLMGTRVGLIFHALRGNEELAAAVGVNVARYRVLAFGICCGLGGIAGACFASFQQNVFPGSYTVADSINFLLYCFLGGLGYVLGPVVGTFVLTMSFELLRSIQQYQALLYGVVMIVVMIFFPNGLLDLLRHRVKRQR